MTAPAVSITQIPTGDAGTRATVQKMRRLVNASLVDPTVRYYATSIVVQHHPRDKDAHAHAIRRFLVEHVRFVPDPFGVEMLHAPQYLLDQITNRYYVQADCDDVAILGAALAKSVGLQARFVVQGFRPGRPFQHVFAEVRVAGRRWVEFDTTRTFDSPTPTRALATEV